MAEAVRPAKTRKRARKAKKGEASSTAKWHIDEKDDPKDGNLAAVDKTRESSRDSPISEDKSLIDNDSLPSDNMIEKLEERNYNDVVPSVSSDQNVSKDDYTEQEIVYATEEIQEKNEEEKNIEQPLTPVESSTGKSITNEVKKQADDSSDNRLLADQVSSSENIIVSPNSDVLQAEGGNLANADEEITVAESSSTVCTQDLSQEHNCTEYEASRIRQFPDVKLKDALPITSNASMMVEELRPFTEEQLKTFYFNPELEQITVFIDEFLQNTTKDRHEFYDLVNTHYKSRLQLLKVMDQIKAKQSDISSTSKIVWNFKKQPYIFEGVCHDHITVRKSVEHELAEFNEQEAAAIYKHLKDLRGIIHEDFQLSTYNSQLAKIRVECYIHEMIESSTLLRSIKADDPISAVLPSRLRSDDRRSLCELQTATTILFSFKRLGAVEEEFCRDVDAWLSRLVSLLQRAGTLPDHFFILNHVIRCPPGSIVPIANYIQFPDFHSIPTMEIWNSPLVHHFVVMLATVALPVKERASFLLKYKHLMRPTAMRSISWTLVDEDREEDENPEDTWNLLLENELVALFEQFPFENLFHYLLRIEVVQDEIGYSVTNSTSSDMVQLLAFTSCVVKLLGKIFDTYDMLRYRQFVKRVSRTIRWVVQVVSEHWCAYRSWRVEICGDSDKDIPAFFTVVSQFSLERLQLEFDQFFGKASDQMLNTLSSTVVQFLAAMPYEAISTNAAWSLLTKLVRTPTGQDVRAPANNTSLLTNANVPSGEIVFFLTSLSNMAISRSTDDQEFIEYAANCILEVTFSDDSIRELNERHCRDFLATICSSHPFLMSSLLSKIGNLCDKLEESCVYLLKALPFDAWMPKMSDLELLRSWLLENSLESVQSRMARTVISKMNFDIREDIGDLFLPQDYHFAVAVMIVEVYGSCVPDGPGGLKTLKYDNDDFISQVSAFAYQSINKILHSKVEDEFLKWCWEAMLSLKLHSFDFDAERCDSQSHVLLSFDENGPTESGSWFANALSYFAKFNPAKAYIEHCPSLLNVQRALDSNGLLACYVALSMTSLGHSPEKFVAHGVKLMAKILESGWVDAALRILSNVIPLYLDCPDVILSCHDFSRVLDTLVHLDANKAGYTEKLWQYPEPGLHSQMLASIITNHVVLMTKKSAEACKSMVSLWFLLLSQCQNWHRDYSVQNLLDCLCKATFTMLSNMDVITFLLLEKFQALVKSKSQRGLISSVMSWLSPNPPIALLDIKSYPDYSYYAYAVLQMEQKYESNSNILNEMAFKMVLNSQLSVNVAYKKVAPLLTASYIPPLQNLSIYRWAEQGLATDSNHPMLPIIWQQFFMLFLQKQNTVDGLPSRLGVGDRFFDNEFAPLAKKMRAHLYKLASYHKEKSTKDALDEDGENAVSDIKSHIHDETMHASLASLYQAMALWIEEPRLHDPDIFLDALPEIYKPKEIEKIFQGEDTLWLQYVDQKCIDKEMESLLSMLAMSLTKSAKTRTHNRMLEDSQQQQPTASQRIVKRLSRENKPRPLSCAVACPAPVEDVSVQLLLARPRLIQELNDDLQRVLLFAKRMAVDLDEHIALDEEYSETLEDLYENLLVQEILHVTCDSKKQGCAGPASVVARYSEKHLKDRNARRLEENRNTWERNIESLTKPLPNDLCTGAVYVERVITKLLKSLEYGNADQKELLKDAGTQLFYLLASLINNDVKNCPPAIQFLSSSTEVLGKDLIADNETQQPRLIKAIFSEEASVSFLAPHFSPHPNMRSFLNLYASVSASSSPKTTTTSFVLLSKFDVRAWLALEPSLSECIFFARAVVSAVAEFGKEPPDELGMLLGLYRSHFACVLRHKFPRQYSEVLRLVTDASDKETLPFQCWADFLTGIHCDSDEGPLSPPYELVELGIDDLLGTVDWFVGVFAKISQDRYHSNSKLYAAWKLYIPYVARFLTFLFTKTVVHYDSCGFPSSIARERFLSNTWNQIFSVYRPWIVPHKSDKSWPVLFVEDSLILVQSFTESCRILADFTAFNSDYNTGLNMVWTFYCAEVALALNQENSLEIYHGLLATLPWQSFYPSTHDLARMLELYNVNSVAFQFLGTILCGLKWTLPIKKYEKLGSSERLVDYLLVILRTFTTLSTIKPFMAKMQSKFEDVANDLVSFSWSYVGAEMVENVCGWFAENCDQIAVLENDAYKNTIIKIFKVACYFAGSRKDSADDHINTKQNIYVQMIVRIVVRAAGSSDFDPMKVGNIVSTLLADMERWGPTHSRDDQTRLYISFLILLNSIESTSLIKDQIFNFLTNTNSDVAIISMLSAGYRVLASLDHLVELSDVAIECFFNRQSEEDLGQAWTRILEVFLVPELNQDQFVRKALARQSLLTVYVYNLQRLPLSGSSSEDLAILTETFHWCMQLPPSPLCPEKTLLIWWQILKGVQRQVFGHTEEREYGSLARYLTSFANSCHQYCEDKSYTGILGAIGLGKKSSFSPQFRLIARSLHVFILAQIPHSGAKLRCYPNAPGDVMGHVGTVNREAKTALQNLSNLKKNKAYAALKEEIEWLSDFISDPKKCLLNADEVLLYTCKRFYPKVSYITAMIKEESKTQIS